MTFDKNHPATLTCAPAASALAQWLAQHTLDGRQAADPRMQDDLARVRVNGLAIADIPAARRVEIVRLAAVQQNGDALLFMKFEEPSEAVKLEAVRCNGLAVRHLAPGARSAAVLHAALTQNGLALQFLLPQERTQALKLVAVRQNGMAIRHLLPQERDEAICLAAVSQDGGAYDCLAAHERTAAVTLAALRRAPMTILYLEPEAVAADEQLADWIEANWSQGQCLSGHLVRSLGAQQAMEWAQAFVRAASADQQAPDAPVAARVREREHA